jgi:hypothetical protein
MADPRATVSFEEVGERKTYLIDGVTITFDATKVGGCASVGLAVMLSAGKTVALTSDGAAIEGKLVKVEVDNMAVVQFEGDMTLPGGLSATLTVGASIVGATSTAGARGYIRSAASGTAAELVKAKGEIIDATTTTAVLVRF